MKTYSNRLLIATTNPGKLNELKSFLSDLPIEIVDLKELGISQRVEETGKTFEENAILKAKYYHKLSRLPTLADDGGFEIDALGGEPGVKTRRWIDGKTEASDKELIDYALKRLKGISMEKRNAQLRVILALALPNREIYTVEEKIRGIIPFEPSPHRSQGYPFRSLLFLPELKKFYIEQELTEVENSKYNHRKRAVEKMKPIIRKILTA